MKTRIVAGAIVAALSLVIVAAVPVAPAFASGTGTLIVELVTPSHHALDVAGLAIYSYDTAGSAVSWQQDVDTDSTGKSTFDDVPSGSYLDTESTAQDGYVSVRKTHFKLKSGQTLVVKLVEPKGGTVGGQVTENTGTAALPNAEVALLDSAGDAVASATADGDGQYTITDVPSGSYRVQFDSRQGDAGVAAAQDFTWSYWRGVGKASTASWDSAKKLTVRAPGAHSSAEVVTGINGAGLLGDIVTCDVTYWTTPQPGQPIEFVAMHGGDSFSTILNGEGDLSTPVNPGEYRIAITGDVDPIVGIAPIYWYVGNDEGPTLNEKDATWVNVTGTTHLDFAPIAMGH